MNAAAVARFNSHNSILCTDHRCTHPYGRELIAYIVFNNLCERLADHPATAEHRLVVIRHRDNLMRAFPFLLDLMPGPHHHHVCTLSVKTNCHGSLI